MAYTHFPHREELANTITHGIGAVASLAAGIVLIVLAASGGDPWRIVGAAVFSVALVVLYTASTLYHGAKGERAKFRLEIMDHCAIFGLIAGTYTPFTLAVRGVWGWSVFGVIWGLAVAGIVLKLVFGTRFAIVSTLIYVGMGWLVLFSGPMLVGLSLATQALLVSGGVVYTAGTLFYHNQRIPYAHAIWHLFVIGGSVLHFLAVALVVAGQ